MKLNNKTVIISLAIVIFILIAILIIRKPTTVIESIDDSAQRERIKELEYQNDSLSSLVDYHMSNRDTIVLIKDSVKTIYREKYVYINSACIDQLDSIILSGLD